MGTDGTKKIRLFLIVLCGISYIVYVYLNNLILSFTESFNISIQAESRTDSAQRKLKGKFLHKTNHLLVCII